MNKPYADIPSEYSRNSTASIVIVPVPYDGTSTWMKGAHKGPEALIDASANMELYDIETDSEVYKNGIFTDVPVEENGSPEAMAHAVEKRIASHLDQNRFTVVIGGEHSVSIGAIKAHAARNSSLCVLQLDAHTDLRPEYHGSKYNHACVMSRAKELCPIIQVGIRSMDAAEKEHVNPDTIFYADQLWSVTEWTRSILGCLTDSVYITLDLDVFDPSIMPSTGTPEPGGLAWYDVLYLLKKVFSTKEVVGFDIVELCPNSANKAPDFLAAKLLYKMLSYKFTE
ncbi:agmatinase [bacterium]|nr:agmatinase [bacterium]